MGWLRDDGRYEIDEADRSAFAEQGFVHLSGVLNGDEVAGLELVYDRFLRREIEVPGKDYCDMAGDYGRQPDDFSIVNVMLPRRYHPEWRGSVYERRTADIARQLLGEGMSIDYDQLLAKRPYREDAVFAWQPGHGVLARHARPPTSTFWLAIDDSTIENGCMRFAPATNRVWGLEDTWTRHQQLRGSNANLGEHGSLG